MGQICRTVEQTVFNKVQRPVREWVRRRRQRCRNGRRWWQRLICWFVTILVQIVVFVLVTIPTVIFTTICTFITITIPSAVNGIVHSIKGWNIRRKNKFPYNKEGWKECFSDEFNSNTLDTTKWTHGFMYGRAAFEEFDKVKVNPPEILSEIYLEKNIEMTGSTLKLWSTNERTSHTINSLEAAYIADDNISAQELEGRVVTSEHTGAWISTHGNVSGCIPKKYGYFEIRAKNPNSWGFWTAFWLTGDTLQGTPHLPWPPEIDVFEFWTNELRSHRPGLHLHPRQKEIDNDKNSSNFAKKTTVGNNTGKNFNIYGCEWNEEEVNFYFNHVKVYSSKKGRKKIDPKEKIDELEFPMGLILDIRIDANWIHKATFPNCLEIDYVRVYERI